MKVTQCKVNLEKALKISLRLQKELGGLQEFIDLNRAELSRREGEGGEAGRGAGGSEEDELVWIEVCCYLFSFVRFLFGSIRF